MKPYFETELGKLYNGDCLEYLKQFKDNEFDLVLTDPPYGIGIKGKVGGGKLAKVTDYGDFNNWDNSIPSKEVFDEMLRVSKKTIIFGGNYFIEYLTNSSCWLVWDKNNTGNFADCELAWTNFKTAVRKYKFTWNGMLQEDMKNKEQRFHPTQKPVELFKMILNDYSQENDLILDCFSGSGTTALASEQLKRRWVGIELQKEYCKVTKQRFQTGIQQTLL